MDTQNAKRKVGEAAATYVENGMKVGLGTGSTANFFIDALAGRNLDIVCVATSKASEQRAFALGLKLSTLEETPRLDLTIDGADEIGPGLALMKGGGGALLYEKIVACASARMMVIADNSKMVATLGAFPLPIEVVPFGAGATKVAITDAMNALGYDAKLILRMATADTVFMSDGGHLIFDLHLNMISDPYAVAEALYKIPGVIEHGLFIGIAKQALIVEGGVVRELFV